MSSQEEHVPVEAAASLFASEDGVATDLFDPFFNEPQSRNSAENSIEPFLDSSDIPAANLFEGSLDKNAGLFSHDPSLNIFPPLDSTGLSSIFEPEADTVSYENESSSQTGCREPEGHADPLKYDNPLHAYEHMSYQPNDRYPTNYYQPGQTNHWTTYATSSSTTHSDNYVPQSFPSQYSRPAQVDNVLTSANDDCTPLANDTPIASQYFPASGDSTSFNSYSQIEPPNPLNTVSDVTAYRPKTSNAYDPPIPTKSRVRSRYAPPNNSLNYASLQSSRSFTSSGSQPYGGPPSQLSAIPPTVEGSQNTHSYSSELNTIYPDFAHDNNTAQRLDYTQHSASARNTNNQVIGGNHIGREGPTYTPHYDSMQHLQSEPPFDLEFANRTTLSRSTAIVDQGLSLYSPEPELEPSVQPDVHTPNQSGLSSGYVSHEAGQESVAPTSIADDRAESNTFAYPTQNAHDPYAPNFLQQAYHPSVANPYDKPPNAAFTSQKVTSREDQGYTDSITTNSTIIDRSSKVTFLPISTTTTHAPYAPSPTLVGANDPLGRVDLRAPVISFGFGGKLISCFHLVRDAGGFDVSLTARQTTSVMVRSLTEVIPVSAMESNGSSFPGPLFSDSGTPSLARTVGVGVASQVKSKKALVIKWLDERANELSNGMAYIASESPERQKAEGRLVLLLLLKVMVENDGLLSGSPSIEWAVRTALVPRLRGERVPASDDLSLDHSLYTPYLSMVESTEQSTTAYYVKDSSLERIKEFLVRGEKVKAYHFAMDEKLWAHAMLIANSVDAQAYKEVVGEFIHSELGVKRVLGAVSEQTSRANGKESLRVAYGLFSGQGASSIQELIPSKSLSSNTVTSAGAQFTPVTPNFQKLPLSFLSSLSPDVLGESLAQWQETAAMVVFTQASGDSAALTSLGDCLAANRWFEAAHACYLLSPRTSSFGGITVPSVRMILVGSESPATLLNFNKDLDVTLLSEIVEFALSLSTSKGQDPFSGLPHLQAYKLLRAYHLAEMGCIEAANRYCEAIGSTIRASSRGSQFYTPSFINELKKLSDRLTAIPQSDKSGSWVSRTMTKPSFDTIGGWLESRFSKIIVGEGEDTAPSPSKESHAESQAKATYGPFSHYSSISSAAPSVPPSRSATPHTVINAVSTSSALSQNPIDRAASAIDYARLDRRRASPIQRVASANAIASSGKSQGGDPLSQYRAGSTAAPVPGDTAIDALSQGNTWWGSNTSNNNDSTPTAAAFHTTVSEGTQSNFISLMDDAHPGFASSSLGQPVVSEEDEEDLGFGNASITKNKVQLNILQGGKDVQEQHEKEAKEETKKPAVRPELVQQSSSWFGGLWNWRRGSSQSPAPVVANLGEEKSFYYDKELKRWVNKNAPESSTTATPPPPPPRAKTASPSVALSNGTAFEQNAVPSPPPPRSSSAMEPPRKPPRVRSNLVPQEGVPVPSSAPPVPNTFDPPGLSNSMPASRPKSSASKRNVRSRYVDVFQNNA